MKVEVIIQQSILISSRSPQNIFDSLIGLNLFHDSLKSNTFNYGSLI